MTEKYDILFGYADPNDPLKDKQLLRILLTSGEFSGIMVTYDFVTVVNEDDDGEKATLQFDYKIHKSPAELGEVTANAETKNRLGQVLGDILIDIITNYLDDIDAKDADENRKSDTQ